MARRSNLVLTAFALAASLFAARPAHADYIEVESSFGLMALMLPTGGGDLPDLSSLLMPEYGGEGDVVPMLSAFSVSPGLSMLIVATDPRGGFPIVTWDPGTWTATLASTSIVPESTQFRFVGGGYFPGVEPASHIYHGEEVQTDAPISDRAQSAFVAGLYDILFGSGGPFGSATGAGGLFEGTEDADSLIRYFASFDPYGSEGPVDPMLYNQVATILFANSYSRAGPAMPVETPDGVFFSVETNEIIFPHVPFGTSGSLGQAFGFPTVGGGLGAGTGSAGFSQNPIPEPGTFVLIAAGAIGLAIARRRRRAA